MNIAIYGGSFDPPHLGHYEAVKSAQEQLCPDKLLIIPTAVSPHKSMPEDGATAAERIDMCALAFTDIESAEISDIELTRQGKSFTSDTVSELHRLYPDGELSLIIGADMLRSFEQWHEFKSILGSCALAVIPREDEDERDLADCCERLREGYSANVILLDHQPLPMSSSEIRERLPLRQGADMLADGVYSYIIKHRLYGAKPELSWLWEKTMGYLKPARIAHVAGCESEAVLLARRYGVDEDSAAEAGILHDVTKKLDPQQQLLMCEKYGIICDNAELANPKLFHAKTGAAFAQDVFGVPDEIYEAIRWHTTGKPDMTKLEMIVYLADYIEPTRSFPGLDELREKCCESLEKAMRLALEMSLDSLRERNIEPYKDTVEAFIWYNTKTEEEK